MRGFTLIEILLVVSFVAVMVLAGFYLPFGFRRSVDLDGQSRQIIEILTIAQSNAKSRFNKSAWGVRLEPEFYALFKGTSYNPNDNVIQKFYLADGLEISRIELEGGGSDIVFKEFSSETNNFGTFRVNLIADPSQYREIRIDLSGQVSVAGPVLPPRDTRVFDSRHVHFRLDWSIKNSTKITFYFPLVGRTEEVSMAEYFNADKTDFEWAGDFTIDGELQEFRIHTHSLTIFDTLLSVSRDRSEGKNNKEVRIFIDYGGQNREIARYFADGSVAVGDYGGTMEIQ